MTRANTFLHTSRYLLVLCLLAPALTAGVVYQTGFEAPAFSAGQVAGQDGWNLIGTASSAVIQAAAVASGLRAVAVTPATANFGGAGRSLSYSATNQRLTISIDAYLSASGTASYWTVITANLNVTGGPGININNRSGEIDFYCQGDHDTGVFITRGTWNHFEIDINFVDRTASAFYNGRRLLQDFSIPSTATSLASVAFYSQRGGYAGTDTAYFDNLTVTSDSQNCSYSLPRSSQAFPSAGGTGTVSVQSLAGCSWTAASDVPWLSITGGAGGIHNGTVTYTVAANSSSSSRAGTVTVGGQTFNVTQSGTGVSAACAASVPAVPQVPLEGRTEPLGDLVLTCTGLTGSLSANVALTLNANITNALASGLTDATLTVNGAAAQKGRPAGYNVLFWPGVVLTAGTNTVRITGVRADGSLLGAATVAQPASITGTVSVTAPSSLPVSGAPFTMARAAPTLAFTRNQATPPAGGAQTFIPLVYQETGAAAFHPGTRLRLALTQVPSTVQVYAPVYPNEGTSRAQLYSADANGAGGSPVAGTSYAGGTYQQLTVTGGSAAATWVVAIADTGQTESFTFPLLVTNATANDLGQILAAASLAPVSEVAVASAAAPVPRYRDNSVPLKLVNLRIRTSLQTQAADSFGSMEMEGVQPRVAVSAGSNVTFTTTLTNDTADPTQTASNVVIRDNLPSALTLISCTASGSAACNVSGNQVEVNYGTMAPGQSATISVLASIDSSVPTGALIENPVSGSSDDPAFDLGATNASTSFIVLKGTPVTAGSTPAAGSGSSQSFTFRFSHPSGYQYLNVVNVLINNFLDGRNACYVAYSVPFSTLYLVDDAGRAGGPFAGSVVLGSSTAVQNSQCAVNLVSATPSTDGTTLTLVLNIAFKSGFAGNRIVYTAVRDVGNANSDWQAMGVWQPSAAAAGAISVTAMTPNRGAAAAGTNQQFTLTLADTRGASDFGIVNVLINNFIDGRRACYLAYAAATNTLYLVNDAGDAGGPFAGAMALNGSSATLANSQCSVAGSGSSAAFSANSMTLTLSVTFKTGFAGNRVLYVAGRDRADGNNTDWQAMGTFTVQ
jgi:uncharacterized repeat protein (TIGR01451 family)